MHLSKARAMSSAHFKAEGALLPLNICFRGSRRRRKSMPVEKESLHHLMLLSRLLPPGKANQRAVRTERVTFKSESGEDRAPMN